jgi:hypothetical protein
MNVTWYNFGPLTTAFKAPASCSSEIPGLVTVINNTYPEDWNGRLRMNCDKLNGFFPTQLSCQPSAQLYESLVQFGNINAVQTWYQSPGIFCPVRLREPVPCRPAMCLPLQQLLLARYIVPPAHTFSAVPGMILKCIASYMSLKH